MEGQGRSRSGNNQTLETVFQLPLQQRLLIMLNFIYSITAGTASASAVLTHYEFSLLQVCLRHSADAGRLVVGIFLDDAGEATEFFKAWLLPLCNQFCICVLFLEQIIVELS